MAHVHTFTSNAKKFNLRFHKESCYNCSHRIVDEVNISSSCDVLDGTLSIAGNIFSLADYDRERVCDSYEQREYATQRQLLLEEQDL